MENPGCSKARRSSLPANTNDRLGCSSVDPLREATRNCADDCRAPIDTVRFQLAVQLMLTRLDRLTLRLRPDI